jgi:hypothetical protein
MEGRLDQVNEYFESAVKSVSTVTYSISGSLVLGDWLQVLNQNAAAFGAIIAFLTFATNLVFQVLNHRAIVANNGGRRRD